MFATINEKDKIIENKYLCEKCNFNTLDKTDYNRHIQTLKHKKNQNYLKLMMLFPLLNLSFLLIINLIHLHLYLSQNPLNSSHFCNSRLNIFECLV